MKPAWRGVVLKDGSIWAWPMLLMDHGQAFDTLVLLKDYRTRWRQWRPGEPVDFDDGTSFEDQVLVERWVAEASS